MRSERSQALRDVSKLSVEVSELLRHPGASKRLSFVEEVDELALDMGRVEPLLRFDLLLEGLVDGIRVSGAVTGEYALACSRCLRSFTRPLEVSLDELLAYPEQGTDDDRYEIVGDHAHLQPIVRDAVVLDMPLNPLCRPDCRGLCATCGADRNDTDCGHRQGHTDLRWEPLSRLWADLGE
jgi:uncharacterized protein